MKIAIISDIHGNYDALVEVLKKAKMEGVLHLLILGDIVGYYYQPDKILNLLSEWSFDMIKGNHENLLENLQDNPSISESIRLKYGSGHKKALIKLDKKLLSSLFCLPSKKTVVIDNVSFELNHGTPWDADEYLYPDAKREKIIKCNSNQHDFVLMGHTHYAFSYKCEHSIIINPGSVGQSREKGGFAYWSLVDTKDKSYELRKTPYDISNILKQIKFNDPDNEYLSEILKR
jgi:predicted phosphodiesterase